MQESDVDSHIDLSSSITDGTRMAMRLPWSVCREGRRSVSGEEWEKPFGRGRFEAGAPKQRTRRR